MSPMSPPFRRAAVLVLALLAAAAAGGGCGSKEHPATAPASPAAHLLTPNGGETLAGGSRYAVTWTAGEAGVPAQSFLVAIDFSSDGGGSWHPQASNLPNTGSWNWSVPFASTTAGRLRLTATAGTSVAGDASDGNFTVTAGYLLTVGSADGRRLDNLTVPLSLENVGAVRFLRTTISYDPTVATFLNAAPTPRVGTTMIFNALTPAPGQLALSFEAIDQDSLPAGSGDLARLTFELVGANQSETALTPGSTRIQDPRGDSLEVQQSGGRLRLAMTADRLTSDGWSLFVGGNFDAALDDFSAAADLESNYAPAYVGQGWCRFNLAMAADDQALALESFDHALTADSVGTLAAGLHAGRAAVCLALGGGRLAEVANEVRQAEQLQAEFSFPYRPSVDFRDLHLLAAFADASSEDFAGALTEAGLIQPSTILRSDPSTWAVDGVTYRSFEGAVLAFLQKLSDLYAG